MFGYINYFILPLRCHKTDRQMGSRKTSVVAAIGGGLAVILAAAAAVKVLVQFIAHLL